MGAFLRVMGAVSLAWAALLLGLKEHVIAADQLTPLTRALANGLGIANGVLALVFWYAARDPAHNRGAIYAAITFAALRTSNDLHGMLVLLPPDQALVSLADLVLSVGLLVGILEALPRTLATGGAADERKGE